MFIFRHEIKLCLAIKAVKVFDVVDRSKTSLVLFFYCTQKMISGELDFKSFLPANVLNKFYSFILILIHSFSLILISPMVVNLLPKRKHHRFPD